MVRLPQDLHFAIRQLAKSPAFACLSILTFAVATGAVAGVYSIVRAVLLDPLPFDQPEKIVTLTEQNSQLGFERLLVSSSRLHSWQQNCPEIDQIAGEVFESFHVGNGPQPFHVHGSYVTANYFSVLGVPMAQGRGFLPAEAQSGAAPTAIITHSLWNSQFGAQSDILEHTIQLNGQVTRIIGVLPQGFRLFNPQSIQGRPQFHFEPQLFTPYTDTPESRADQTRLFVGIGRLAPETSRDQAQASLSRISQREAQLESGDENWSARVTSIHDQTVGASRPALILLTGAVMLVLTLASANVASLQLSRSLHQQKEMAIRAAVGGEGSALMRPVLWQSLMIALCGGLLGFLVAEHGIDAVLAYAPNTIPRLDNVQLDAPVFLTSLLLTALAGLGAGLLPAWHHARTDPQLALQTNAATVSHGAKIAQGRQLLLTLQIAIAVMLLLVASLLVSSFQNLQQIQLGFQPDKLVAAHFSFNWRDYETPERRRQLHTHVSDAFARIPGVESAATITGIPFGNAPPAVVRVTLEGDTNAIAQEPRFIRQRWISPGYFETMGTPILGGREFNETDTTESPLTVIVNQTFANTYLGTESPLGRRLRTEADPSKWQTVIGIVPDSHSEFLNQADPPTLYVCTQQDPPWMFATVIRTALPSATLRAQLESAAHQFDHSLAIYNIRSFTDIIAATQAPERFTMTVISGFSLIALLLAVLGMAGLTSSVVASRWREFGIRMALGADRWRISRSVLLSSIGQASAGIVLGLIGSQLLSQLLSSQLYGIGSHHPGALLPALLLAVVSIGAGCFVPIYRATKTDPLETLREP